MGINFEGGMNLSGGMSMTGGSPAPAGMTWYSTSLPPSLSLSNNNRTVTKISQPTLYRWAAITTSGNLGGVANGQQSMFSVTMNLYSGAVNDFSGVGFISGYIGAADDSSYIGGGNQQAAAYTNGDVYAGGAIKGQVAVFQTNGSVIDVALDRVNNKYYWRVNGGNWNNVPGDNPATNTGGIVFTEVGINPGTGPFFLAVTLNTGTQFTINGTSPYSVPAGFTFIG